MTAATAGEIFVTTGLPEAYTVYCRYIWRI